MKHAALFALVLLSACGGGERAAPGTPQRACEDAADEAPAVKLALAEIAGPRWTIDTQREYQAARNAEITRCLRDRGVVRRGGVQAVKP
jgi:hypothetical protein